MSPTKLWTFFFTAMLPVQFAGAQFVELEAEIQVSDWLPKGMRT